MSDLIHSISYDFIISLKMMVYLSLIYLSYKTISYINYLFSNIGQHDKLISAAKLKRKKRDEKISEFYNTYYKEISKKDIELITSYSVEELVNQIKNKKITAKKVFLIYALNIATVGKELEYIADCDLYKGLKEAELADEIISQTKDINKLPALIGLPISVKDHIKAKGYIDSIGYADKINNIAEEDSEIVEKLKQLGVVILTKSNVPQGLMALEASNNVWGSCKNIWNEERTTGGSSGGESGLVSSFCTPLGLGSDAGGSIRIPAFFTGVYGFKPSENRNSNKGVLNVDASKIISFKIMNIYTGFFSRKFEDLVFLSKLLYGSYEYHEIDNRPFDDDLYNSKETINIGYGYNFKNIDLHSDIKESIDNTIIKMKEKVERKEMNYEFVEIDTNKLEKMYYLGFILVFNSGAISAINQSLKGEKEMYYLEKNKLLVNGNSYILNIAKTVLKLLGEKRAYEFISNIKLKLSAEEYFKYVEEFLTEKQKVFDYFKSLNLKAFILPILPTATFKLGNSEVSFGNFFYSIVINMLTLPSVAVPTGFIKNPKYLTSHDDKISRLTIDDVATSLGCPFGFQVAALPGKDEVALRVARDVISVNKINHNDLKNDNKQTSNFWKYRNI